MLSIVYSAPQACGVKDPEVRFLQHTDDTLPSSKVTVFVSKLIRQQRT
jgi:hypothetical protein